MSPKAPFKQEVPALDPIQLSHAEADFADEVGNRCFVGVMVMEG